MNQDAIKLARDITDSNGIVDLERAMRELDVYYQEVYDRQSPKTLAIWRNTSPKGKIIVINRSNVTDESMRRYVLAHCLGHLVTGYFGAKYGGKKKEDAWNPETVNTVFDFTGNDHKNKLANDFALDMLVPRWRLLKEIKNFLENKPMEDLTDYLVDVFNVPREAIEYRLRFVKIKANNTKRSQTN